MILATWAYYIMQRKIERPHHGFMHYTDDIMGAIAPQITSLDCLLNRLFRRRSKKTSQLRVTGLCVGNSPGTSEFPAQMASNAENVSIWWRHRVGTISELEIIV